MPTVYLSLGSNVGNREKHLESSLKHLAALPGTKLLRVSRLYETSPCGVSRQRDYLNAAVCIETRLSPMGLLAHLKTIEAARGRKPAPRWSSRALDIDILFYGRRTLRGPFLNIPHPRALRRLFVLSPLAEIAPRFKPPNARGHTVQKLLTSLSRTYRSSRGMGVRGERHPSCVAAELCRRPQER